MAGDSQDGGAPHRRRLLFAPGFDPRKPTVYHDMWVQEAAAQALATGARITVGPRRTAGPHALEWTAEAVFDGRATTTRVTLLRWDDLVRRMWLRGDVRAILETAVWAPRFLKAGVFAMARRGARPLYLCLLTPPVLLALLVAAVLGVAALGAVISPWLGLPLLAVSPFAVLAGWRGADRVINTNWLVQCFSHVVRAKADPPPDLVERCRSFAATLIEAADDAETDEVLLVGFSLGANLAVRALGMALEMRPDLGRGRTAVNLLTLGQSLNIYRRLPGDPAFDAACDRVATATAIGWVDATSVTDPASTCGVEPVAEFGAPAGRPERRPPRFHKVLTPERYRAIRRDPNAFHFQYLKAVDIPGGYDWFRIAAGPDPLVERKAGR